MNVIQHSATQRLDSQEFLARQQLLITWLLRGGAVLVLGLSFLYLVLSNSIATKGFSLQELKENRIKIQKEVEKWDISLAIPVSLYALEASEQVQGMKDVEKKNYMFVEAGALAMGGQ